MKELVKILMERDGISKLEAENLVYGCRDAIYGELQTNIDPYEEVCDIIFDYLGLEPDYIDYFL